MNYCRWTVYIPGRCKRRQRERCISCRRICLKRKKFKFMFKRIHFGSTKKCTIILAWCCNTVRSGLEASLILSLNKCSQRVESFEFKNFHFKTNFYPLKKEKKRKTQEKEEEVIRCDNTLIHSGDYVHYPVLLLPVNYSCILNVLY